MPAPWFYAFRTAPGSELTAAGAGVLAGMLPVLLGQRRGFLAVTVPGMLAMLLVGLLIPYAKMLLLPLRDADFTDSWTPRGICMQSTIATCGPASAATLLHAQGYAITECELARESFSSRSGTEIWYPARALRRHRFSVQYQFTGTPPDHLPYPAIAGTSLGDISAVNPRAGHFIAILGETHTSYLVGDPLRGSVTINKANYAPYHFSGFFLVVQRRR